MPRLEAGQVWTYTARPGEEASRLTVLQIDPHEKFGEIVHVCVTGVAQKNPFAPGGVSSVIGHMPFSVAAVEESVLALEASGVPLPEYRSGYDQWKTAFDAGKGGVFTIPVAQAVQYCEEALANAKPMRDKEKNG